MYFKIFSDFYATIAVSALFFLLSYYVEPTLHDQKNYLRRPTPKRWGNNFPVRVAILAKCTGGENQGVFRTPISTMFRACNNLHGPHYCVPLQTLGLRSNPNPVVFYHGVPLGWRAVLDALNPWDQIKCIARTFRWILVGRVHRTEESLESVQIAILSLRYELDPFPDENETSTLGPENHILQRFIREKWASARQPAIWSVKSYAASTNSREEGWEVRV